MPNFVVKLPKTADTSFFITQTIWNDQEINISVFDGDSAWAGRFTKEDALGASETLGLSFDEYWTETRRALSTNHGADTFQYALVNSRFMWAKLVEKDVDKKLEYGSVALEPGLLSLLIERMIDSLIDRNHCIEAQLKQTEEEKCRVDSARKLLVTTLHRHTAEKRNMEDSLYSNFLEILNAKKKKIAALEELHQIEPKLETKTARKPSGSRTKPVEWRKTVRTRPVQRAKKAKKAADTPLEEHALFKMQRMPPETREAKKRTSSEKSVPAVEAIRDVNDAYDSDTDIDDPPKRKEPIGDVEAISGVNDGYDSDTDIDDTQNINTPMPVLERTGGVNLPGFESDTDIDKPSTSKEGLSLSFLFEDFRDAKHEDPTLGGLVVADREVQAEADTEMTRSQRREFNTQKLLDDLGI